MQRTILARIHRIVAKGALRKKPQCVKSLGIFKVSQQLHGAAPLRLESRQPVDQGRKTRCAPPRAYPRQSRSRKLHNLERKEFPHRSRSAHSCMTRSYRSSSCPSRMGAHHLAGSAGSRGKSHGTE